MIRPQPVVSAGPVQVANAVRELGRAMAHLDDFQSFIEILELAVKKAGAFEGLEIILPGGDRRDSLFSDSQISVPLPGRFAGSGVLKVSPPVKNRTFGAEDLHLVSALASLIGILVEHASLHRDNKQGSAVLSVLLNLAPLGLVALDETGAPLFVNNQANRWLGASASAKLEQIWSENQLAANNGGTSKFHLRLDGKLIYAEAVKVATTSTCHGGATVIALVDLTIDQVRFIDALQRELYRCRWLEKPFTFVLLESKTILGGLLHQLSDIRANLNPGEAAGPYDAFRIGLVLPECDRAAAVRRVRGLLPLMPNDNLQVSIVAGESETSVEALLGAAVGNMGPIASVLKRALLLHDDYPAVNDMLALVLGRSYEIVKSSRIEESMAFLRARSFDGLVTEIELRAGGSGLELARLAKQLQPAIRPIFTTVAHSTHLAVDDPLLSDHIVLRKPFDVKQLEETIKEALP